MMHRTQIYFEEPLFDEIKKKAATLNISVSAYIRDVLKKELDAEDRIREPINFSNYAGLWQDSDVSLEQIRNKAWK